MDFISQVCVFADFFSTDFVCLFCLFIRQLCSSISLLCVCPCAFNSVIICMPLCVGCQCDSIRIFYFSESLKQKMQWIILLLWLHFGYPVIQFSRAKLKKYCCIRDERSRCLSIAAICLPARCLIIKTAQQNNTDSIRMSFCFLFFSISLSLSITLFLPGHTVVASRWYYNFFVWSH